MHILVNLPPSFFQQAELQPVFERLRKLGEVRTTSHNSADEIRADLAWADAVVMWSWPKLLDGLLDDAPNLRFAGHIDIAQEAARVALRRNLPVSLSRHGWSPAVAELALGLILSTLRKISDYHAQMRTGNESWVVNLPGDIDPRERQLTGRSVGIVGLGNVGRRLAELLEPFQVRLHVVDPFVPASALERFQARQVDVPTMIRECDIVVLCAAANPGTRHLIGREEIALFRQNAILVNVARATLVDTEALIERLQREDMFAAIDVFDREPLAQESVLRTLPNAYLTPHRAGGVLASVERVLASLVDDLEAHLAVEALKYPLKEYMLPSLDA